MAQPPALAHPFADMIGLGVSDREDGCCISRLTIAAQHMNPHGVVHGAVIYALADTGMGGALTTLLEENQLCSTIEIKINYFRPAISGELVCETLVVNKGRRTAVMQSSVKDDKGKLVAQALGTFMILATP